ncbi:type II toxin-antitoxin system PrlF family antitoxin [Azorhizobium oxalatiphilum]|nr:type II toxin-antitoxin system PrlF family antitoxin [Azorhizobium oxalatiphilum]
MGTLVEERSKITAKGQTTVPKAVRQALGVDAGDEIAFVVSPRGTVTVRRVETAEDDPVVAGFLGLLAEDMARNPQIIAAFPPALAQRMAELTAGTDVDFDEAIDGPVDL